LNEDFACGDKCETTVGEPKLSAFIFNDLLSDSYLNSKSKFLLFVLLLIDGVEKFKRLTSTGCANSLNTPLSLLDFGEQLKLSLLLICELKD